LTPPLNELSVQLISDNDSGVAVHHARLASDTHCCANMITSHHEAVEVGAMPQLMQGRCCIGFEAILKHRQSVQGE
jgi:hypothetical protein